MIGEQSGVKVDTIHVSGVVFSGLFLDPLWRKLGQCEIDLIYRRAPLLLAHFGRLWHDSA